MNTNGSSNSSNIPTHTTEGLFVITCGLICTIGNFFCIVLIICHRRFRKTTVVILIHHCFLDFMKSLYCFPYGYSLLTSFPAPYCNLIGSSYVFIVTTSAYNMMALVVNQEYEIMFTDDRTDDGYCVVFGVFIIWFMSFLLNLGISIIPSNTQFNSEIGICLFLYGCNFGYIVHVLWILLVTIAISLSLVFFCRMRRDLVNSINRYRWERIHHTLTEEFEEMLDFNITDNDKYKNTRYKRSVFHSHLRTTNILLSIVILFTLHWYPLFTLTLTDFYFTVTPKVYRILTIIALIHPITTPILCSLVLRDMEFKGYTLRDISSNLMPLRRITSRQHHYENRNVFDFDCKSYSNKDLVEHQMPSNIDQNDDIDSGFVNRRFVENDLQFKVTSTV